MFYRLDNTTARPSLGINAIARAIDTRFHGDNGTAFSIPVIANEVATILRSQRLRGFRYLRLNLLATCRGVLNSFRPILAGNIRHATHLSESVESRGFSAETMAERTSLRTLKMGVWDYSLLVFLFACLIGIVGLKLLYFFYANGIYYGSWLRGIYTFTREVL